MHLSDKHTTSRVDKIADGDQVTFKGIFDQYYAALCFFANRLVNDKFAAEDLVEDVFIKLWNKENDFNKYRSIKAVLYISVRNACYDLIKLRRRKLLKQGQLNYLLQGESGDFVLNEMTRAEVLGEIYAALQTLPPECRKVMELVYREGWNFKKISTHLGVAISTVRNHKAHGIKALKKKLGTDLFLLFLFFITNEQLH
ncbi:MAG: polymerase, sigma-24 subunit, subfamily [Chitinophagaceae bacterium]|nr:polymerase, sigma-24 subunit, subfamily [Chitinophagaceae bacterium]